MEIPGLEELLDDVQNDAAYAEWANRVKSNPASAWLEFAMFCAASSFHNDFWLEKEALVIYAMPTKSGRVVRICRNNPFQCSGAERVKYLRRREIETDRFRKRLMSAGIAELAYATYPRSGPRSGDSYAMILDASKSQIGAIRRAMRVAMS
jgi:hypothetical protein